MTALGSEKPRRFTENTVNHGRYSESLERELTRDKVGGTPTEWGPTMGSMEAAGLEYALDGMGRGGVERYGLVGDGPSTPEGGHQSLHESLGCLKPPGWSVKSMVPLWKRCG
ncbi:unnamed protein product, partial [Mesorhabditis belari]|uniref:Uncharacterized protein n=1 Tax=Mesorhabditis belari TaxID=2138241 RepID=A0AAF3FUE3_9BILA